MEREQEELKLRTAAMGGYQKKDVFAYISSLQAQQEQRENALTHELSQLREELARLEAKEEAWQEEKAQLEAAARAAQEQIHAQATRLQEMWKEQQTLQETLAQAKKEREAAYTAAAEAQAELIAFRERREEEAPFPQPPASAAQAEPLRLYALEELLQEVRSYRMIAAALRENGRNLVESLSRQLDYADRSIAALDSASGENRRAQEEKQSQSGAKGV